MHHNQNSFDRWAEVFSLHAHAIVMRHVENGGTLDPDNVALGLTVDRLKAALWVACPDEALPDDDVLYSRLALLTAITAHRMAKDTVQLTAERGRMIVAELEALAGEKLGSDPFADS